MAAPNTHGLPSPAPSNGGSVYSSLPAQHPLKPGSNKEIKLIGYADERVLYIRRRYGTKFTNIKTEDNEPAGYTNFDQLAEDVNPLIDLVWSTGTVSLQLAYLLTLGGMIASYMPAFPLSTKLFQIVKRLDTAFSTLIRKTDETTSRPVVRMTDKVRIRSVVEETRVNAVHVAENAGHSTLAEDSSDDEDVDTMEGVEQPVRTECDEDIPDGIFQDETTAIAISRIYESTMELLGDSLTG